MVIIAVRIGGTHTGVVHTAVVTTVGTTRPIWFIVLIIFTTRVGVI
jgi:hypothetical protein